MRPFYVNSSADFVDDTVKFDGTMNSSVSGNITKKLPQ